MTWFTEKRSKKYPAKLSAHVSHTHTHTHTRTRTHTRADHAPRTPRAPTREPRALAMLASTNPTGLPLLLACLLVLAACPLAGAVEYNKFCESVCAYGRGGNLCNCNAVHFAGKRGGAKGVAAGSAGPRRSTGQWPGASAAIAEDQHLFWLKRALRSGLYNVE